MKREQSATAFGLSEHFTNEGAISFPPSMKFDELEAFIKEHRALFDPVATKIRLGPGAFRAMLKTCDMDSRCKPHPLECVPVELDLSLGRMEVVVEKNIQPESTTDVPATKVEETNDG